MADLHLESLVSTFHAWKAVTKCLPIHDSMELQGVSYLSKYLYNFYEPKLSLLKLAW